ncbi:MAG: hypothetical protein HYX83_00785 [Chloroflexi bacterium]|nr:hypothetical protein [Chloroflexota bacterium]
MRDCIGVEKLGTPAVAIVTQPFLHLAKTTAEIAGTKAFPVITIPHPQAGLPRDLVAQRIGAVMDDIVGALTKPQAEEVKTAKVVRPEPEVVRCDGDSLSSALREVNEYFYRQKWTDGFPIVPPTEEAVQWMLKGTYREPDEVVGLIPPAYGKATIRNIAINCVMAGAQPEYMPVVIAAVEAVTAPEFAVSEKRWGLAGLQTSTGPCTPLLIVNGPIAKSLEIISGRGCFSRGHKANATIGRALRLVLTNAGGSYPGVNDMKGQGSSQEFTFCVAEHEEHRVYHQGQHPWKPLHVELGYSSEDSTVTAVPAWLPQNIADSDDCSPAILDRVATEISTLGVVPYTIDRDCVLILGPTHAGCLADAGMTKEDIRQYVWANAVLPWGQYKKQYPGPNRLQPGWMKFINDDSALVHVYKSPENFHVIVAGGDCPYSQAVRVCSKPATRKIKLHKE